MQFLSIKNDGKLFFEGFEDDICEELALEPDEDVENILEKYIQSVKDSLIRQIMHYRFIKNLSWTEIVWKSVTFRCANMLVWKCIKKLCFTKKHGFLKVKPGENQDNYLLVPYGPDGKRNGRGWQPQVNDIVVYDRVVCS